MSLYGALFSGVSGLNAQSTKLSIISDNISNVNTVGYKQGEAQFETLVTGQSSAVSYSPGGVLGGNRQLIDQQGLLTSTNSPTDIAIQGGGFFVVNKASDGTGQVLYTRAGSFVQDDSGNFVNASGFFLQAWPLDRNGNLPGAPGNPNTTSSANLSSLTTVNVQNVTGSASPTTDVSIGANLNAGSAAFLGAAQTFAMDATDTKNFGITATNPIISTAVDSLFDGDSFTVTTGSGDSSTFAYGGVSNSRDISSGTNGTGGTAVSPRSVTLVSGAINQVFQFNPADLTHVQVNMNPDLAANFIPPLVVGDVVRFSGTSGTGGVNINGLTNLDGDFLVTGKTAGTNFTIALPSAGTLPTAQSLNGATYTTGAADTHVVISGITVPAGLQVGDVIHLANSPNIAGGQTGANLDSADWTVTAVTPGAGGSFTINTTFASGAGGIGTGGATSTYLDTFGDILNTSAGAAMTGRLFATTGNILDAQTATQTFLGTTGTTEFTNAALTFSISTSTLGTNTFTYVSSAPNSTLGQFNTLTNLVTAINDVTGLSARIVNNQLYVSSVNGNDAITFTNGADTGIAGPPVQAGIDWVTELGLGDVTLNAVGNRFSTLQGLADLVNATSSFYATVDNPLNAADIQIGTRDPLTTISFADTGTNTGSVLAALGGVTTLNGGGFVAGSIGPIAASYDPTNPATNMASGNVTPNSSRAVTVYDSLGTAHNLTIAFLKTGVNTWAAEVYAVPASDVSNSLDGNGLVANGTLRFNGDGTLQSISNGNLTQSGGFNIVWSDAALPSAISVDWGTSGPIGTGKSDGLSQFDSPFSVRFVNQNGTAVGSLTGVSIDAEGFITASFSNGETQQLYKIPLALFAAPDQLQSITGNVFAQSSASGGVILDQAGSSGVGNIAASALESSNVELANQLTDMIVAQRAYQANTKVISTADQLLNDLDQILQ